MEGQLATRLVGRHNELGGVLTNQGCFGGRVVVGRSAGKGGQVGSRARLGGWLQSFCRRNTHKQMA